LRNENRCAQRTGRSLCSSCDRCWAARMWNPFRRKAFNRAVAEIPPIIDETIAFFESSGMRAVSLRSLCVRRRARARARGSVGFGVAAADAEITTGSVEWYFRCPAIRSRGRLWCCGRRCVLALRAERVLSVRRGAARRERGLRRDVSYGRHLSRAWILGGREENHACLQEERCA
jgi:hypothetical protein